MKRTLTLLLSIFMFISNVNFVHAEESVVASDDSGIQDSTLEADIEIQESEDIIDDESMVDDESDAQNSMDSIEEISTPADESVVEVNQDDSSETKEASLEITEAIKDEAANSIVDIADSSTDVEFNGHTYRVVYTPMTWHEANAYCQNLGGHLATVQSQAENDFLAGFFDSDSWLGATDEETEGEWHWITGEPFDITRWGDSEPNGNEWENHLMLMPDCIWIDGDGNASLPFVCEFESGYSLKVSCHVSGRNKGNLTGFATVDVYIDGELAADDVSEYWVAFPEGTRYAINDVKTVDGVTFQGIIGDTSGTIQNSDINVVLELDAELSTDISEGSYTNYVGRGWSVEYRFMPTESGVYYFYSVGSDDSIATLYDEDYNEITGDDDSGDNGQFKIATNLEAGKTYYYSVKWHDSSFSDNMTVVLEKYIPFAIENQSPLVEGRLGSSTEISIPLSPVAEATGLWYNWEQSEDGVDWYDFSSERTITVDEWCHGWQFRCTISDDQGWILTSDPIEFRVVVEADEINEGEVQGHVDEEATHYYQFTPAETGKYYFYAEQDQEIIVRVYDENLQYLMEYQESMYHNHAECGYDLEAGKTYYYKVSSAYGEDFDYVMELEKYIPLAIVSQPDEVECFLHQYASIEVELECSNALLNSNTYLWEISADGVNYDYYSENNEPTVELYGDDSTHGKLFRLTVTDYYGNSVQCQPILFTVKTDAVTILEGTYSGTVSDGEVHRYKFTPSESGVYYFYNTSEEVAHIEVYDQDFQCIQYYDFSGWDFRPNSAIQLDAGRTYYYSVECYGYDDDNQLEYTVALEKYIPFEIVNVPQAIEGYLGDVAAIGVELSEVAVATYLEFWWEYSVDGVNWDYFTSDPEFTIYVNGDYYGWQFRCTISDDQGREITTDPIELRVVIDADEINVGEVDGHVDEEETHYYRFTPTETGKYYFYTEEGNSLIIEVYDENFQYISSYYTGAWENPSDDGLELEAGHVYYYGVQSNGSESFDYALELEKDIPLAIANQPSEVEGYLYENTPIEVEIASAHAALKGHTYFWERSKDGVNWDEYEYTNQPSIEIYGNSENDDAMFRLTITDGNGNSVTSEPIPFNVVVDGTVINEGSYANYVGAGEHVYYSFTPSTSGTYYFYSQADSDSFVTVYDSHFEHLTENDDSGESANFKVALAMEAGETYYFEARWYNGGTEAEMPVKLEKYISFTITEPLEDIEVAYGETVHLQVGFSEMAEGTSLGYEWHESENGVDWRHLSYDAEVDHYADDSIDGHQFKVMVTDDIGNVYESGPIVVTVVKEPIIIIEQPQSMDLAYGEAYTLTVNATGKDLYYEWEVSEDESFDYYYVTQSDYDDFIEREAYEPRYYRCHIFDSQNQEAYSDVVHVTIGQSIYPYVTNGGDFLLAEGNNGLHIVPDHDGKYSFYLTPLSEEADENWYVDSHIILFDAGWNEIASDYIGNRYGATYDLEAGETYHVINSFWYQDPTQWNICEYEEASIITGPQDKTVYNKSLAEFAVEASGTLLRYEWEYSDNGIDWWQIHSSYEPNYVLYAETYMDGYQYRCRVIDITGYNVYSEPVILNVNILPLEIESIPEMIEAEYGDDVTITTNLAGIHSDDFWFEWEFSTDGEDWYSYDYYLWDSYCDEVSVDDSSSDGSMLTLHYLFSTKPSLQVRAHVYDDQDQDIATNSCVIDVCDPVLEIITQPVPAVVPDKGYAEFHVEVNAKEPYYQWQYHAPDWGEDDWSNISGANDNVYSFRVNRQNGYLFRCVITDIAGNEVVTDAVGYTIQLAPVVIEQTDHVIVNCGSIATMYVIVDGDNLTYEWQCSVDGDVWETISGQGTNTLEFTATEENGYRYRCLITDSLGQYVVSDEIELTVNEAVVILSQPQDVYADYGELVNVTVEAEGTDLTYQWFVKGAEDSEFTLSDVIGNVYSVVMSDEVNGSQVYCLVTDANGNSVETDVATLTQNAFSGFKEIDGELYWYEEDVRQGVYGDPRNVWDVKNGIEAGREIYDPGTDCWYWLQAQYDGAVARNKEIWMPYIYMDDRPGSNDGKWVRYDQYGLMVKNWYTNDVGTYYYDQITGARFMGEHVINGETYYFDETTGVLIVRTPLEITSEPQSQSVKNGEKAVVSVEATGDGLTYQWYLKNKTASKFSKSSVTKNIYSVTMSDAVDGRQLYCIITDRYGDSLTTETVTLTKHVPFTGFKEIDGKLYWYENDVRQGTYGDPQNIWDSEFKIERGREIYDPETDAWYWLDALYDGAAARNKEVWLPYVFMDEEYGSTRGKWVRYDESCRRVAGWYTNYLGTYYYDLVTGAIYLGEHVIEGETYYFDERSGLLIIRIPLQVTRQPQSQIVKNGEKAVVSVEATGDGLTYQWYLKNKTSSKFSKSSVTKNTYSVTMSDAVDGRQVYCVITDKNGDSITTDTATLSKYAFEIISQPQDVVAANGEKATATVEARGEGLVYQWYVKAKTATKFSKSSVTKATYSTTMSDAVDGRQIYCVITDRYGDSITTDTVTLSKYAFEIISQPQDVVAANGEKVVATVEARGEGLAYQWYVKARTATKFSKSSVTKATYSTTMSDAVDGRQIYCVITDKNGDSITTDTVTLSKYAFEIISQPQDVVVANGEKATVTVEARGEGLSYQWYVKARTATKFSKSSVIKATYSTTMSDTVDGRQIYCVITDRNGDSLTTDTVTLSQVKGLSIVTQPEDAVVAVGEKAIATVVATGEGLTYQWYIKNATSTKFSKSSVTKATYSVAMSSAVNGRQAYCVVTDKYGNTVTSETVVFLLSGTIFIVAQPQNTSVPIGEYVTVAVDAKGDGLAYQWYVKTPTGTKFSKSSITTAEYRVEMTEKRNGNQLYCVITDANGNTVTTDTVTITAN